MRWCRCSSQPRAWHTVGAPCGGLGDRPSRARGPCCPCCTLFPEPHPSSSQLPPSPCGGSGSPGGLADRKTQARSSSGNPDQARGASLSQSSTQTGHLQIILPLPLPRGRLSALTFSALQMDLPIGVPGLPCPHPAQPHGHQPLRVAKRRLPLPGCPGLRELAGSTLALHRT